MVQPISLLMSHFNVENTARITPAALAAAQDTVQGQELVQDSIRVTQTVQASTAAAEAQRVHRRTEEEEREDRRRNSQGSFEGQSDKGRNEEDPGETEDGAFALSPLPEVRSSGAAPKGFDLYV